MVAEPDKVLVGERNEWVANPLGPGQTSALQVEPNTRPPSCTTPQQPTMYDELKYITIRSLTNFKKYDTSSLFGNPAVVA